MSKYDHLELRNLCILDYKLDRKTSSRNLVQKLLDTKNSIPLTRTIPIAIPSTFIQSPHTNTWISKLYLGVEL